MSEMTSGTAVVVTELYAFYQNHVIFTYLESLEILYQLLRAS